jgi:hypothetical protein
MLLQHQELTVVKPGARHNIEASIYILTFLSKLRLFGLPICSFENFILWLSKEREGIPSPA